MSKILIGPILGLESENVYTIIIQTNEKLELTLDYWISLNQQSVSPSEEIALEFGFLYRFEINITPKAKETKCTYQIRSSEKGVLITKFHTTSWTFYIPGKKKIPRIYTCSCNGDPGYTYTDISNSSDYLALWGKMKNVHNDYPGHLLIMSGDQVYADQVWEIDFFQDIPLTMEDQDLFIKYDLDEKLEPLLLGQLEKFYEKLYQESWGYVDMAFMMASVPSIMIWDDHDIFDGFGSLKKELQESYLFKKVFQVAKKYFSLFQARTIRNQALISPAENDFSQYISFRNYEILVLDGRSHRTADHVHSRDQWDQYKDILDGQIFNKTYSKSFPKTLCIVSAVPMAHFYYPKFVEFVYGSINKNNFRKSNYDDTLDQWSHNDHKDELKYALDLFKFIGNRNEVDYLYIISGDVHSAGVARAYSLEPYKIINGEKYHNCISQIVSSPIVHPSHSNLEKKGILLGTREQRKIEGYDLRIKNYGDTGKKQFTKETLLSFTKDQEEG